MEAKYGVIETSESGFCDKEYSYFDTLEDARAAANEIAESNNLTSKEKKEQWVEIDIFETNGSDCEDDYTYINSCEEIKYK